MLFGTGVAEVFVIWSSSFGMQPWHPGSCGSGVVGFASLWGIAPYSPTLSSWLTHAHSDAPTVAGFLYVALASVGLGQLVSTLRRLLIDSLHHRTRVNPPTCSFRELRS